MKSCDKWYPFLTMIATDFAFATINILLKKVIDEGLNHLVFITYRLLIATILLAPVGFFLERNVRPKLTASVLCHLFFSAIVGASLTQYLFLLGIEYTSATFSCAFVNMVPVVTFIMALPFGLETLNIKSRGGKAKMLGTVVCLGGALLLTLYKGMPLFNTSHSEARSHETINQTTSISSVKRKERWTIGSMALLAGTLLWSSWFLLQSNISKRYPCQYSATVITTFFGSIQSAILCMCLNRNLSIWIPKEKIEILSIIYAGMIGSGLCYVGMSWCVKKRGPVFTAAFSPYVQIMAAIFDVPLLHEQLHIGSVLGSIIVVAGLYILLWGKNEDMQNCVAKVAQETEEIKGQEPEFQVITVTSDSQRS